MKKLHVIMGAGVQPRWCPQKGGWVKLNSDGAFADNGRADAGMVLRDEKSSIIFSACRALFSCRDTLEAELCACMEGLFLAIQRSELSIIVEMDSVVAVKLIQAREQDRSVYASVVKEIRHLMGLRECCITHIYRTQNKVRHNLAKFARVEGTTMTWLSSGLDVPLALAFDDSKDNVIE